MFSDRLCTSIRGVSTIKSSYSLPLKFNKINFVDGYGHCFIKARLEVVKPAPGHFCRDFMSTANATVSTPCRDVLQGGTLLQSVRVGQDSHMLNTHPYPQSTRATIPNRHSFARK
ncbi:hypothetical protein RF11_01347 [Thelohanellus kitauei]|uniref:Uncharacterized protein n=1 Tax=Thelohanellus kitauei TaxID=669202 RepID=A0A0C2J1R0_THEKT|nr:hypothetical protein RF11_01347 [Thelohanellus kitauei]